MTESEEDQKNQKNSYLPKAKESSDEEHSLVKKKA
jgi:hypothetical protein